MSSSTTAFVGLSPLGLVASVCWASLKRPVAAVDIDTRVIRSLKDGHIESNEPGLNNLYSTVRKHYTPTNDFSVLKNIPLVFFTRDTPFDGSFPENLDKLIKKAVPYFQPNLTIVIMSQVPVGFCRGLVQRIRKKRPNLSFTLHHWVETVITTRAVDCFLHPTSIIIGVDNPSKKNQPIFRTILKHFRCPVFYMSYESAELTKASINLYLATSVAFANTVADFCEVVGANINEMIPALRSDKRIGQYAYLRPGLGIAGGHLERDIGMLTQLAQKKRVSPGIVRCVDELNKERYRWVARKLESYIQTTQKKPKVCLWGLAYKKNSASTQNAASTKILQTLGHRFTFSAYDPLAILPRGIHVRRHKNKYEAARGAHCLVVLTDWDEFKNTNVSKLKSYLKQNVLIDCTGIFDNANTRKMFTYIGLGVANS